MPLDRVKPDSAVDCAQVNGALSLNVVRASDDVVEKVRALGPIMRAHNKLPENATFLHPEVIKGLDDAGVFKIPVPEENGGTAMGTRDQVRVVSEVARFDGSAAWVVMGAAAAFANFGLAFPRETADELIDFEWVGPMMAGSIFNSAHSQGKARKVDGGWMVKGRWGFSSNIGYAAFLAGGCDYATEDGSVERGTVLLRADQYTILDDWHVMGMEATSSNTVLIEEEVFIPDRYFVRTDDLVKAYATQGDTFGGLLYKTDRLVAISVVMASISLGIAKGALEMFIEQARKRKPFGLPYPTMADVPSIQISAGRIEARIAAAEAAVYRAADRVDAFGVAGEEIPPVDRYESEALVSFASLLCNEVVDEIQLTLGSSTASLSNPIQRLVRDVRAVNLHGVIRHDLACENRGRHLMGLAPHTSAY